MTFNHINYVNIYVYYSIIKPQKANKKWENKFLCRLQYKMSKNLKKYNVKL